MILIFEIPALLSEGITIAITGYVIVFLALVLGWLVFRIGF